MLLIRDEQVNALKDAALRPVRQKFISLLRSKLPEHASRHSDAALDALCDKGIARAASYGLQTEYNVYVFIAVSLVLTEDFDTNPATAWSEEILRDQRMAEDVKAKLLELRVLMDTETDVSPHGR